MTPPHDQVPCGFALCLVPGARQRVRRRSRKTLWHRSTVLVSPPTLCGRPPGVRPRPAFNVSAIAACRPASAEASVERTTSSRATRRERGRGEDRPKSIRLMSVTAQGFAGVLEPPGSGAVFRLLCPRPASPLSSRAGRRLASELFEQRILRPLTLAHGYFRFLVERGEVTTGGLDAEHDAIWASSLPWMRLAVGIVGVEVLRGVADDGWRREIQIVGRSEVLTAGSPGGSGDLLRPVPPGRRCDGVAGC